MALFPFSADRAARDAIVCPLSMQQASQYFEERELLFLRKTSCYFLMHSNHHFCSFRLVASDLRFLLDMQQISDGEPVVCLCVVL